MPSSANCNGGQRSTASPLPSSLMQKNYGALIRRAGLTPGVASVVFVPAAVTVTVGGMAAFYSVVLRCSTAPEQSVTVAPVNLPTGLRIFPTIHVFTQENWRKPQFFRVSVVNDGVIEELRGSAAVIEHTTSSLDPRFHGRRVLHLPSAVQACVYPRDGYCLFATGKTAAFASQQKRLAQESRSKQPLTTHEFTEVELRRSILASCPLVARCSTFVPMAAGAKAAVAAVEAANQAAALAAHHQSRRKISTATAVVKAMAAKADMGPTEEPTTAAKASQDHNNALTRLIGQGDKTLALYHDGEMLVLGVSDIFSSSKHTSRRDSGADVALSRMLVDVACGDRHVVAVSEQGYLLKWGDACEPRPRNETVNKLTFTMGFPKVIHSLLHKRIIQVACGANHSFALAEDGDVFSWGLGHSGALGHGLNPLEQTFDSVTSPMEVLTLKGRRVMQIACGDMHSAALLATGELLTCGQRDHGRLGRQLVPVEVRKKEVVKLQSQCADDEECSSWFAPVAFPRKGVKCTHVACGSAHTLVIGASHELYAFGWNSCGQLGVGDCRDRFVPTRVTYFDVVPQSRGIVLPALNIASVAAGKLHSLASAPDGRLFAWGSDEMGQCGLSPCPQIYTLPHLVTSLVGLRVTQLAVGEAHSAVLTSHSQRRLELLERTQPTQYDQLMEHYENSVKDDTERRSRVLEHAKRIELDRATAARRRRPPVDPATEAITKMLLLQSLIDQDAAMDTMVTGRRRPQTARALFGSYSRKKDEAENEDRHQGTTICRVRCSSASMVRQARLTVLQAPVATIKNQSSSASPPRAKPVGPPYKPAPSSTVNTSLNRRAPCDNESATCSALKANFTVCSLTGGDSGRRTPETPHDEKLPEISQKNDIGRRRTIRKLKVTTNIKLEELAQSRLRVSTAEPLSVKDSKSSGIHCETYSNQEDSVPSRKLPSHEAQRQLEKPALEQIAQFILPPGTDQANSNPLGSSLADVPLQLLQGAHVDLRRWSVIVTDRTLRRIAAHNHRISNTKRKVQKLQSLMVGQRQSSFLLRKEEAHELSSSYLDARNQTTELLQLNGAATITDAGLASIALAVPKLKELAIAGAIRITDAALRVVGEYCSQLERLDVSGLSGIRGAGLAALVDHCGASLTHLSLADCPQLGDWVLRRCLYASPGLTHLNLSRCSQVGDALIETLAAQCPLLRRLELSGCIQISDRSVVRIARSSPNLEYMMLDRPICVRGGEQLTDSSCAALGEYCPNLRFVSLAGNCALTDAGVQCVASRCAQLRHLDLTGAIGLTDATCAALGAGCPELRVLRVNGVKGISDVGLRLIAAGCAKLELLHAANLYLVSDGRNRDFGLEGLRAIASRCPELQNLNLNGCFQLQERALVAIGLGCPSLRKLSLQACPDVTLTAITAVLKGCQRLVRLDISGVRRCDDRMIRVVAKYGIAIAQLILAGCDRVSDAGLRYLANSRADQLELLDLTGCRLISDNGINVLCDAFQRPKLAHLVLADCPLITQDPIARLAFACPQLLTLSVHGCRVSARVLQSLSSSWPFGELRLPPAGTQAASNIQVGIFPAPRAKDRRFVSEFCTLWAAAATIQQAYKSNVDTGDVLVGVWLSISGKNSDDSSSFNSVVLFEYKCNSDEFIHCAKLRDDVMQSRNENWLQQNFRPFSELGEDGRLLAYLRWQNSGVSRILLLDDCNVTGELDMIVSHWLSWLKHAESSTKNSQRPLDETMGIHLGAVILATPVSCDTVVHGGGKRRLHNKRKLFDFYGRRRDYGDGEFPSIWPSEILQDAARGYDFEKLVPRDNYQDMMWEISRFVPVSTGNWDDELAAAKAAEAAAAPAFAHAFAALLSESISSKPNDSSATTTDVDDLDRPGVPSHHLLYREKDFDENGVSLWERFYDYGQGQYRYYHRISKRVVTQLPGQMQK
ncbi:unnamed protein product [Phytophthora fragariaefolia]|uniref:Unnamed protein product n=1 Tax=Phytophthora fragariaefolia TaxID=1490495 RepID=A0A9W6YIT6_9STRA|nr:unnamed protein product [Phytophthora fragariaefolia]